MHTAGLTSEPVFRAHDTLWRLEPVICLANGERIEGWELLTHSHLASYDQWRRVYAMMPDVIVGIRERHAIKQPISINLNTRQILDPDILNQIQRLPGRDIRVEWTEYGGVSEHDKKCAAQELVRLRETHGFGIWIDDAGNGEDAIGRMSITQPDAIKIDGALFQSAHRGEISDCVLRALLSAAKEFGAMTIIEWIETEDQLRFAQKFGADMGQGFLWPTIKFGLHPVHGNLVRQ